MPPIRSEAPAATRIASATPACGRSDRSQSSRGWAKIIRPATVWRTRVTVTSRSLSMSRAPPSTTIIVPSSRKPTPWPGLLALLDHPDPQLLAGEHRGLHGVRQRVDVHDPHALQLGDPVEVEVVGQDDAAPLERQRDELRIDLGLRGIVVLDDLDRGRRLLLHAGQDLEAAPAAVAAQGVGRVGDVLELVEDEPRHHERAVDEPRFDDLGDPAVDDRATCRRRCVAPRCARGRRGRVDVADDADRLRRSDQVLALGHGETQHPEAQQQRDAQRQPTCRTAAVAPRAGGRAASPSAARAAAR